MQYAIINLNENKQFLLSANEIHNLDMIGKGHLNFQEVGDPEDDWQFPLQIHYGSYISIEKESLNNQLNFVKSLKNALLKYFDNIFIDTSIKKFNNENVRALIKSIGVVDIVTYSVKESKNFFSIPFAILLQTPEPLKITKSSSLTCFPYKACKKINLDIYESFLNRSGFFAIGQQEKRTNNFTLDNWTTFIDKERCLKVANGIK